MSATLPKTRPALRIEIPHTPHKSLSPNRSGHQLKKERGTKYAMSPAEARALIKRSAFLATMSELNRHPWPIPPGRIGIELFVYWERGRKHMDDDNLIASCKGLLDGIARGLAINDQRFKFLGIEQDSDPDGAGCVVALLREWKE